MHLSVRNQAYRKRQKHRPKLPESINEVNISSYGDLTLTKQGKPYYRGRTASSCEVFATDVQLTILAASKSVFVDATFSITPVPFYQVLFISALVGENAYPVATALMPNKLEASYVEVFNLLLAACDENGLELDVENAHSDCETGLINAVKKAFPNARNQLCRFHVVDASHANGQGLRSILNTNSEFKLFYARVRQIFFYPIDLWPRIYLLLLSKLSDETKDHSSVEKFLSYLVRDSF